VATPLTYINADLLTLAKLDGLEATAGIIDEGDLK
jgi:hypothetical protein